MEKIGPPPGPDTTIAFKYLVPCGILEVLAITLCVARIYTRFRRLSRLFLEDYLVIGALMVSITNYAVIMAAAAYGWGRHSYYVSSPDITIVMQLNFSWGLLYFITITLIRVSIACSLLRLSPSKVWRTPLYLIIALQILICTGYFITIFGAVTPVNANWTSMPNVAYWPKRPIEIYTWITAAMMIVMDLCLALMPTILIKTLHRPPREKILIACLMATGLLATAFACYKTTTFHTHGVGDPLRTSLDATLFAKLEEEVGIIAACMPCLKHPAEELLRRVGVLGEQHFLGVSRPSFMVSRRDPGSVVEEPPGRFPLQDVGRLLHEASKGSELGLVKTRSTEWACRTTLRETLKSESTRAERALSEMEDV